MVVGWLGGTVAALGTAVTAFLVYDLLFTEPRFSLVVADPNELLNLVLVLIVALAVGRLAALGRERATEADRRAAEATGLFAISRLLATADATEAVADPLVERIARETGLERVWIGARTAGAERVLADTGAGRPPEAGDRHDARANARRRAGPVGARARAGRPRRGPAHRARATSCASGSRPTAPRSGRCGPSSRRARGCRIRPRHACSSLAADQIALGLRRDRLRQEATSAEVARRSDALKSALLDSVSHDLRTPLASIRATAGNLADPDVAWTPDDTRRAAESIDAEARRLDRLVRSVLDLSRIESGRWSPMSRSTIRRSSSSRPSDAAAPTLDARPITIELADDCRSCRVDAVLFDAIVSNVLDNIADHTPPTTAVAIGARRGDRGRIVLTIEDGGPGVADADLPRVFDKFQRSGRPGEGPRHGMGVGLSIVRGMTEVLGGTATARRSGLGGLAIDIDLPAAPEPPPEAGGS